MLIRLSIFTKSDIDINISINVIVVYYICIEMANDQSPVIHINKEREYINNNNYITQNQATTAHAYNILITVHISDATHTADIVMRNLLCIDTNFYIKLE